MPSKLYADLPPDALEHQRQLKRKSWQHIKLRRVTVLASSAEILQKAQQAMPPGLSLNEFLSQLIDRIADHKLVPSPPTTKKP